MDAMYELTQSTSEYTLEPGEKMTAEMLAELLLKGQEMHGDLVSIRGEGLKWYIQWDPMSKYDRRMNQPLPDEAPPELIEYRRDD